MISYLLEDCKVRHAYNVIASIQKLNSLQEDQAIYYIKKVMSDKEISYVREFIRVMDNVWVCDHIEDLLEISWRISLFYL